MSEETYKVKELIRLYEEFLDQNYNNLKNYSAAKSEFNEFKETLLANLARSPQEFE